MIGDTAKDAARSARASPVLQLLARVGFAVNGLLHLLIGFIAIGVATGGGGEADQSGALSHLAAAPLGILILWTVTAGLAALGLWVVLGAFLFRSADSKKRITHFVKEFGKGVAYLAVAATAFTFARGGSSSSSGDTTSFSADLLSNPGGVLVLVLVAALVFGIGAYFVYTGATHRFTGDIAVPSGAPGKVTVFLGVFGYVAKGIALMVVGVLFGAAAFTADAAKATGLDGALQSLSELPQGTIVLSVIGIGLITYGVYGFARARYARL